MFGIGFIEIVVVLLVALIFVGPEKLPKMAISAGKLFKELRKTVDNVKLGLTEVETVENFEKLSKEITKEINEKKASIEKEDK